MDLLFSKIILFGCVLGLLTGCATAGRAQKADLSPGWKRVGRAAAKAALSPGTWVPAAGAAAVKISGADERISDWATEHNPVFGSDENARRFSNGFVAAAIAVNAATILAAPAGGASGTRPASKLSIFLVDLAANGCTSGSTQLIKRNIRRLRPDESDRQSFPSGHTSSVAVNSTLSSKNIDFMPLSSGGRTALKTGFLALTAGTGWARVEGKKHYASDVLVGAALGNFFGAFINDAFISSENINEVSLNFSPTGGGRGFSLSFKY